MDEYGRMGSHKHRKAKPKHKLLMVAAVIVIILIAVFAYYFLGGPINVSGPTTLAIGGKGTVFSMAGKSYVATLEGFNSNTRTAYVYVSAVPVFLGPLLNVTLHQNSTVKVNYDSQYAIMQMELVSGNGNSASVQVAPLAASLQIDPDYQYIGHPNASMPGLQVTVTTTTNTTTTSVAGGSTSSGSTAPTTSVKATTTVAQATNYTASAIETAVKTDRNYGLMLNFTTLYDQTVNCDPHTYNLSYFDASGTLPVPPSDYKNVSYETPYGMVQKIVSTGGNGYSLEFLPLVQDPAFNGTVALAIGVTVTSPGSSSAIGVVSSDRYGGIFLNETYSVLSSQYAQTKAVGNACGALVG
jgi:hypothetical protein